jgi:hypothetical protein
LGRKKRFLVSGLRVGRPWFKQKSNNKWKLKPSTWTWSQ